ncbi:MAG: porin, partial [Bacteroidales bacterium]|nr:porin [Bacteroidales bacterium]
MKNKVFGLMAAALLAAPVAAFAQDKNDDAYWVKDVVSRIQINGYAQAGYTSTHLDGTNTNTWDVKRTLLWAKARVTDRWSFLFMHDFNSQV